MIARWAYCFLLLAGCKPEVREVVTERREHGAVLTGEHREIETLVPQAPPLAAREYVNPAPLMVGMGRVPSISNQARRLNAEGMKQHHSGHFHQAVSLFREALAVSPDHDLARYNLACALSRSGDFQGSAQELREVVIRDPSRFVTRIEQDQDLELFRQSSFFPGLAKHVDEAKKAWSAAFQTGVPALSYDYTPPQVVAYSQYGGTQNLIVGLYLHDSKKFLPLAHGGDYAYVDMKQRRVVQLDSEITAGVNCGVWRDTKITVVAAAPDETFKLVTDLDKDIHLALNRGEEVLPGETMSDISMASVAVGLEIDLEGEYGQESRHFSATPGEVTYRPRVKAIPKVMPTMDVVMEGTVLWDPPAAGHFLKGSRYRPPGVPSNIHLGAAHAGARWQSLVVSPDGLHGVITSIKFSQKPFTEGECDTARHAISRVDLQNLEVHGIARGKGTARALFGSDGALYVQSDNNVWRFAHAGLAKEDSGESIMKGVSLVVPFVPYVQCGDGY